MGNDALQLREIAMELRRLQHSSPCARGDFSAWHEESRRFARRLSSDLAGADLPEEVWHYLHDADLRAKDPCHKQMQDRVLDEIIADLERGIVPAPRGATVSFHPRWIGVAGLLLVSLVMYWILR